MRLAILAILAATAPAHADPPKCKARDGESYRSSLLLLDGLAAGALVAAYYGGFPPVIALPAYWLGTPMIHNAHGRCGRAVLSLSARIVLPSLGARIAKHADDRYLAVGLAAGAVVASALDIGFLGRAEPFVAPAQGGATVGVVASF